MTDAIRPPMPARALVACLWLAWAATSCNETNSATPTNRTAPAAQKPAKPLPPAELRPVKPELQALVDAHPGLGEERLNSLRDLLETAYRPNEVGARLAERAKRSLDEEKDATIAYEHGLLHDDAAIRSQSAWRLGQREDKAAIPALLMRLKYEKDPMVLSWVVDALDRLDNRAGLDLRNFIGWLHVGPMTERMDIATEVGRIGYGILQRTHHPLGQNPDPTYPEIENGLRALARGWQRRGIVSETIPPELPPRAKARIAKHLIALDSQQMRPVDDARKVLKWLGRSSVPMLRKAIHAQNNYLRNHSLEVLRELGPSGQPAFDDVVPLLGNRLSELYAIQALGRMADPRAVQWLIPRLEHRSLDVRIATAEALGLLGAKSAREPLETLLAKPEGSTDEKVYAAFALAMLGVETGRETLAAIRKTGKYHDDTLSELLDRVDSAR